MLRPPRALEGWVYGSSKEGKIEQLVWVAWGQKEMGGSFIILQWLIHYLHQLIPFIQPGQLSLVESLSSFTQPWCICNVSSFGNHDIYSTVVLLAFKPQECRWLWSLCSLEHFLSKNGHDVLWLLYTLNLLQNNFIPYRNQIAYFHIYNIDPILFQK